MIIMVNLS